VRFIKYKSEGRTGLAVQDGQTAHGYFEDDNACPGSLETLLAQGTDGLKRAGDVLRRGSEAISRRSSICRRSQAEAHLRRSQLSTSCKRSGGQYFPNSRRSSHASNRVSLAVAVRSCSRTCRVNSIGKANSWRSSASVADIYRRKRRSTLSPAIPSSRTGRYATISLRRRSGRSAKTLMEPERSAPRSLRLTNCRNTVAAER
jgi:hypothetical protein